MAGHFSNGVLNTDWPSAHLAVPEFHQPEDGVGGSAEGPGGQADQTPRQYHTLLTPSSAQGNT